MANKFIFFKDNNQWLIILKMYTMYTFNTFAYVEVTYKLFNNFKELIYFSIELMKFKRIK